MRFFSLSLSCLLKNNDDKEMSKKNNIKFHSMHHLRKNCIMYVLRTRGMGKNTQIWIDDCEKSAITIALMNVRNYFLIFYYKKLFTNNNPTRRRWRRQRRQAKKVLGNVYFCAFCSNDKLFSFEILNFSSHDEWQMWTNVNKCDDDWPLFFLTLSCCHIQIA